MNKSLALEMKATKYMGFPKGSTNPQTQLELILQSYLPSFSFWYYYETKELTICLGDRLTGIRVEEPLHEYDIKKFVNGEIEITDFPDLLSLIKEKIPKLMEKFIVTHKGRET